MSLIRILLFILPLSVSAGEIKLENVSVHLFLEKSGVLSKNVINAKEFFTHNFHPFGEGFDDNEVFHELLIKVSFTSNSESYNPDYVARIELITVKDNEVVFVKDIKSIYVGQEMRIYKGIWVQGHECEKLMLKVSAKDNVITHLLPFHCGE